MQEFYLLRRHGIKAVSFDPLDVPRFQACWLVGWQRMPLWARRRILRHWRQSRYLHIELLDCKADWFRGNSGAAIAQCGMTGLSLSFSTVYARLLDRQWVVTMIAHELAHVLGHACKWESHVDPDWLSECESDVDEVLDQWGYDVDGFEAAKHALNDHPDVRAVYDPWVEVVPADGVT